MRINIGIANPHVNYNPININQLHVVKKPIVEKIKTVARVVFTILLSLALFSINPAIFFISFVVGIAFNNQVRQAVDKISTFMKHYRWPVIGGMVLSAIVVLPVFIATASTIWACHVGSLLSQRAEKKYHPAPDFLR